MRDNCYYVAGKSATFTDNRPGNILSNANLDAWKAHIGGNNGSLEVNPAITYQQMRNAPIWEFLLSLNVRGIQKKWYEDKDIHFCIPLSSFGGGNLFS